MSLNQSETAMSFVAHYIYITQYPCTVWFWRKKEKKNAIQSALWNKNRIWNVIPKSSCVVATKYWIAIFNVTLFANAAFSTKQAEI